MLRIKSVLKSLDFFGGGLRHWVAFDFENLTCEMEFIGFLIPNRTGIQCVLQGREWENE